MNTETNADQKDSSVPTTWQRQLGNVSLTLVQFIYGFLVFCICATVLVIRYWLSNSPKYVVFHKLADPLSTVAAILFVVGCCWFAKHHTKTSTNTSVTRIFTANPLIVTTLISVVVFILQLYIVSSIHYTTRWDPGFMMQVAQDSIQGKDLHAYSWYFNMYPNNLYFEVYLRAASRVALRLGLDASVFIADIGALCVTIAGQLSAATVQSVLHKPLWTYLFFALYTVLVSFSSWICIPYTDTYLTVFVAAALYFYIKALHSKTPIPATIDIFIAVLAISVGSLFKPTIWVLAIAVVIAEILRTLYIRKQLKQVIIDLILLLAVVGFWNATVLPMLKTKNYVPLEEQKAFSYTHYLAMGLNPKSYGVFNSEDVIYSSSFKTIDARQKADLNRAGQRLQRMGVGGAITFYAKKLSMTYGDGTFGTGREAGGEFPVPDQYSYPATHKRLTPLLRKIFYISPHQTSLLRLIEQATWFTVLLGLACAAIGQRKPQAATRRIIDVFLRLGVLGVTLFLMLFETRPRYLYSFTSLIIILSVLGLERICNRISNRHTENKRGAGDASSNPNQQSVAKTAVDIPVARRQ